MGVLHHKEYDEAAGTIHVEEIEAQWEPIVPPDLFHAVQRKLQTRSKAQRRKKAGISSYFVPIMCARCGTYLTGVDTPRSDGGVNRRYRHQSPNSPVTGKLRQRMIEAGCRTWQVDADEVETALRDLIAAERGSQGFLERLDTLLAERVTSTDIVDRRLAEARTLMSDIEAERRETIRLMAKGRLIGISEAEFLENVKQLDAQHADAKRRVEEISASRKAAEMERQELRRLFDETRAILDRWDKGSVSDRQAILTWWVDHVLIDFDEVACTPKNQRQRESAGLGQRSARRRLIVFLSTQPTGGVELEMTPPSSKQKQLGTRVWERVEIRMSPPPQALEELETSKIPIESVESCRNDKNRRAHSAGCTR